MKRLFNLNSSKKSLSLALLIAGFTVASSGSIVAHAGSQDANVPPVGQDWIKVKLPLKMGYHSTAESKHKEISSAKYKVENLSDYPVGVMYEGLVGKDGSSQPITTGVQDLKMNLSTRYPLPLIKDGSVVSNHFGTIFQLGARSGTPISGTFNAPSSKIIYFLGSTQNTIDTSKLVTYENQLNFELVLLDPNGKVPKDQTSIQVNDSVIDLGTSWNPKDNFISGTNDMGNPLPFSLVTIGGDKVDTSKPGIYKVTYSYRNVTQTATITVKAPISIKVHDSTIKVGDSWQASDNFDGGTDEFGQPVDISKVTIGGDKVDPNAPGTYKVTYSYGNITQTANVVVDGTLTFMNQSWDIIKGQDKMGAGNYLISSQKSIASSNFADRTNYYSANTDTLDGYQDKSLVKPLVDNWYNTNVKGTLYENYVQPVVLSNPTLGDMKKLGWTSNTSGDSAAALNAINQPNAYPTIIDGTKGSKQAFLMSGSDVSDGQGDFGNLIPSALAHRNIIAKNFWLRTPGEKDFLAGRVRTDKLTLWDNYLDQSNEVVPSLVVHVGDAYVQVKNLTIGLNSEWKPEDNFVSGTDESGNSLDISKVTIGGDKVDTSKPGIYKVTYSYRNVSKTANITVKDFTSIKVHDSTINVGATWKASDNFDGGTDELGQPLDISKVTVGGEKVDTSKEGTYRVTYSYLKVTQTATVKISNPYKPILNQDGTISFMNKKWDVIKGTDKLGAGNYMISLQESIGQSVFNNGLSYYNKIGYDDSIVKSKVDAWYNTNIKGKYYEEYIQPVVLSVPTESNWNSLMSGDALSGFLSINQSNAFPTTVDNVKGNKQAFLMSGSDVSNGKGTYGDLTPEALKHANILQGQGKPYLWLRTPGVKGKINGTDFDAEAAYMSTLYNYVAYCPTNTNKDITPSVVVHIP